jgi:two-component system, sensor histidine kinase and response regulator
VAASDLQLASFAAVPRTELRGARVLLVEDSDVIRDVSRSLLEDAGMAVEEAADGATAVAMMRDNGERFQLILMDVQMPVLDGISATRTIRAELGERAPPIIALTAQANEDEKRTCREAGMCDHLTKPVDPDRLIGTMNRWLAPSARGECGSNVAHAAQAETQQVLPAVPGFDLNAGLHCVGGKAALLCSQLVRFGTTYADVTAQLRGLISVQNYRDAHRVAHTLKGAAATLGGTVIAESAARLEQLMLQLAGPVSSVAGPIDAALTELDGALQPALPLLRAMAAAQPDAGPSRVAALSAELPQSEAAEYQALRQLLAGNCYAARKAFAALRGKLGADEADWRDAAAAVDALDFAQVLVLLDARYPANVRKL